MKYYLKNIDLENKNSYKKKENSLFCSYKSVIDMSGIYSIKNLTFSIALTKGTL